MPKKVSLNELKKKMGDEIVKKLYDEFAGRMIYVPKKSIDMTQDEKEMIIYNLFYEAGVDKTEIAERMNLSIDRTTKILKKMREKWIEDYKKLKQNDN